MKIFAFSDFHGAIDLLPSLKICIKELSPDVIVFAGDVVKGYARGNEWLAAEREHRDPIKEKQSIINEIPEDIEIYHTFYKTLDELNMQCCVIPGNMDAPEGRFFAGVLNFALKRNQIHIVQENMIKINNMVFSGFGGEITENEKEDYFVLRYPRSEIEFSMRKAKYIVLPRTFIFHTPPISTLDLEGGRHKGSQVINDLIELYQPSFVFCGHAHKAQGTEYFNDTLVINPGAFKSGNYALVDTETKEVIFGDVKDYDTE